MSRFLTKLDVEAATDKDDGNWRLIAALGYQSDVAKASFTAPVGFVTNFASVPRIPIVYLLCGGVASEAAAMHDYLYTFQPVTRKVADSVLREASALTGVAGWRCTLMWLGVRLFGASHWQPQERDANHVPLNAVKTAAVQPK